MFQTEWGSGPQWPPWDPGVWGWGGGGGRRFLATFTPQVYITVLDENDNSPRFDSTSDSAVSVPEDCPVGQRVASVKARDPDAGSNGQVGISGTAQISSLGRGFPQPSVGGGHLSHPSLGKKQGSSRLCPVPSRTTCPPPSPWSGRGGRAVQVVGPAWVE